AESEALETEHRAQAAAKRTVQEAASERDAFLAWLRVRSELSVTNQVRLAADTAALVAAGRELTSALSDAELRRKEMLEAQAFLVDFRLTWETLAQTLSRRDKVFIDADKLPG